MTPIPSSSDTNCDYCGKRRSHQWCSTCEKNLFEQGFSTWTSGNPDIDLFIQQTQLDALDANGSVGYLEWIPFKDFVNVKYLSKSAFSTIYSAIWIDGPRQVWDEEGADWIRCGPTKCALKRIENSNKITKEHLEYIFKSYRCLHSGAIVDCLGITRDPKGRYMIVMKFYTEDLYSHIKHNTRYLLWKDIVNMLSKIASGLKQIHGKKLYHGNLHGGNLLIEYTIEGTHVRISDIGLHGPTNRTAHVVHGVLPYVAPEVLKGDEYTQASDIYSFGIIMWTLSTCMKPFSHISHDINLAKRICGGLRPEVINNIPDAYLSLMKRCWHQDPKKRPKAIEISNILSGWITAIYDYPTSTISMQFNAINRVKSLQMLSVHKSTHPQAKYTSQLFGFPSLCESAECNDDNVRLNRLRAFTM